MTLLVQGNNLPQIIKVFKKFAVPNGVLDPKLSATSFSGFLDL